MEQTKCIFLFKTNYYFQTILKFINEEQKVEEFELPEKQQIHL